MPKTHVVQAGECLASIAKANNFRSWKTIYYAAENKGLRDKRPNPNVLYEGDEVVIPDFGGKSHDRPADEKHSFTVQTPRWVLRLCMQDEEGNGIGGEPYELARPGFFPIKGKTAPDGMIEEELPADTRALTLKFMGEEFQVQIGMLDPVSRAKGVQARLNNLGFNAGAVDGIVGKNTSRAIYAFQLSEGLDATGKIDDETLKRLLFKHDNDSRYTPMEDDMGPSDTPPLVAEEPETGEDPPEEIDNPPYTDWCEPEGCHHEQ